MKWECSVVNRIVKYGMGLMLMGCGTVLMLKSDLGVAAFDALCMGMSRLVQIKKYGGKVLADTNGKQALRLVLMEKNARYVPVRE